jgi:hypothetical protein
MPNGVKLRVVRHVFLANGAHPIANRSKRFVNFLTLAQLWRLDATQPSS